MTEHYVSAYAGPFCGAHLLILPTPSHITPKYVYAPCSDLYSCDAPRELQTHHAIYRIKNNTAFFVKLYNLNPDQYIPANHYPAVAIDIGFDDEDEYNDYINNMNDEDIPF